MAAELAAVAKEHGGDAGELRLQRQRNKTPERRSKITPLALILAPAGGGWRRRRRKSEASDIKSSNRRQMGAIPGVMFRYISAY